MAEVSGPLVTDIAKTVYAVMVGEHVFELHQDYDAALERAKHLGPLAKVRPMDLIVYPASLPPREESK